MRCQACWPRWFVADTAANKGVTTSRWMLVFTRGSANDVWQASYLTILAAAAKQPGHLVAGKAADCRSDNRREIAPWPANAERLARNRSGRGSGQCANRLGGTRAGTARKRGQHRSAGNCSGCTS